MSRLLFLLALVFMINGIYAVSLQENAKSCEQLDKYTGTDASFYSKVATAVEKAFPKGDFTPFCLNAAITPKDKSSATVTVVYVAQCAYQVFSSNPKPNEYKCINEKNERIGNRYYELTGTVNCLGKPNGSGCVGIDSMKDVTPKPSPPSPPAVGVWTPTPITFVPKDIQNAGLAYMMKNAKVTTVAPAEASDKAFYGPSRVDITGDFSRKIDANGDITYRIPGTVRTQSASRGCEFPVLSSSASVDVKKAAGKYTFSILTEEEYSKGLKQDSGAQPKCVGQAAWKVGVAKVDKFCNSVKGGCSRMNIED